MKKFPCPFCGRPMEGPVDRCPHCGTYLVYEDKDGHLRDALGNEVVLDNENRVIKKKPNRFAPKD